MSPAVYNAALCAGVLMIGAGVAAFSVPLAGIVTGALVIALTIFNAKLATGR